MTEITPNDGAERPTNNCALSLRMPESLERDLEETAAAVKLSKQDTARLALERGLRVLLAQLTGEAA